MKSTRFRVLFYLQIRPLENKLQKNHTVKKLISTLILLSGLLPVVIQAQKKGAPANPGEPCRLTYLPVVADQAQFLNEKPLWSAGMKKKKVKQVLAQGVETAWPKGLSNSNEREANKFNIKKLVCYRLTEYTNADGGKFSLLVIPAASNQHMPAELRPLKDIYLLVRSWCVQAGRIYDQNIDGTPLRYYSPDEFYPGISKHCRIIDRGELYSSISLKDIEGWQQYFEAWETDLVAEFCLEDNWPRLISTLENRQKYADYFKYYNAYAVGKFSMGNSTAYILHIAVYDNEHMPEGLAPQEDDIYFVIGESGLDFSRGWDEFEDGYPEPIEEEEEEFINPLKDSLTYRNQQGNGDLPPPAIEPRGLDAEINPGEPLTCFIVDRGSLYSTLSIDSYRDELEPYVSDVQYVIDNAHEDAWPSGISTLDGREKRNTAFRDYKVRALARFGDNFYLLEVKPEDNAHMPEDMRPSKTIYFIFGAPGLGLQPVSK